MMMRNESADDWIQKIERDANEDAGNNVFHDWFNFRYEPNLFNVTGRTEFYRIILSIFYDRPHSRIRDLLAARPLLAMAPFLLNACTLPSPPLTRDAYIWQRHRTPAVPSQGRQAAT
jgi:hypothetical protein